MQKHSIGRVPLADTPGSACETPPPRHLATETRPTHNIFETHLTVLTFLEPPERFAPRRRNLPFHHTSSILHSKPWDRSAFIYILSALSIIVTDTSRTLIAFARHRRTRDFKTLFPCKLQSHCGDLSTAWFITSETTCSLFLPKRCYIALN